MRKSTFLLFILLFITTYGFSQISKGGNPVSFSNQFDLKESIKTINITPPNVKNLLSEDIARGEKGEPLRFGITIDQLTDFAKEAEWESLADHSQLARLRFNLPEAKASAVYYQIFEIPEGDELYLYSSDKNTVLGAFDSDNNSNNGVFATSLIPGESFIMEYHKKDPNGENPLILISEILYAYKNAEGYGDSDFCEVNINCPEGDNWQDQKRGVVRILIKDGNSSYWCSGSLINNTQIDFAPYILTADHCAGYANQEDIAQWLFYFNYESEDCNDPEVEPVHQSMVGADVLARGGNSGRSGSDFFLVELFNHVPNDYLPFFNGWDISNSGASQGVSIHHPYGDIKKISTFTNPLVTDEYNSNGLESHWRVIWSETETNYGVTEGGSSGSPIFNTDGLIIGTLTGGLASCSAQQAYDYYGKMSYHWDQNGTDSYGQLKPWLNPNSDNITSLPGMYMDEDYLFANFSGDTSLLKDGYAVFKDLSVGNINTWHWEFENGTPSTSDLRNPEPIQYKSFGTYNVTLTINGDNGTKTITKENYVKVRAQIYPTPTTGDLFINLGVGDFENITITIYDLYGRIWKQTKQKVDGRQLIKEDISSFKTGNYFIEINIDDIITNYKVVKF